MGSPHMGKKGSLGTLFVFFPEEAVVTRIDLSEDVVGAIEEDCALVVRGGARLHCRLERLHRRLERLQLGQLELGQLHQRQPLAPPQPEERWSGVEGGMGVGKEAQSHHTPQRAAPPPHQALAAHLLVHRGAAESRGRGKATRPFSFLWTGDLLTIHCGCILRPGISFRHFRQHQIIPPHYPKIARSPIPSPTPEVQYLSLCHSSRCTVRSLRACSSGTWAVVTRSPSQAPYPARPPPPLLLVGSCSSFLLCECVS